MVKVDVKLDPCQLAELFVHMDSDQQAEVLSLVWHQMEHFYGGSHKRAMQCAYMRDSIAQADGALDLLEELREPEEVEEDHAQDPTHRRCCGTMWEQDHAADCAEADPVAELADAIGGTRDDARAAAFGLAYAQEKSIGVTPGKPWGRLMFDDVVGDDHVVDRDKARELAAAFMMNGRKQRDALDRGEHRAEWTNPPAHAVLESLRVPRDSLQGRAMLRLLSQATRVEVTHPERHQMPRVVAELHPHPAEVVGRQPGNRYMVNGEDVGLIESIDHEHMGAHVMDVTMRIALQPERMFTGDMFQAVDVPVNQTIANLPAKGHDLGDDYVPDNLDDGRPVGVVTKLNDDGTVQVTMNAYPMVLDDGLPPRGFSDGHCRPQSTCDECKGTGWYEGFNSRERCSRGCPE